MIKRFNSKTLISALVFIMGAVFLLQPLAAAACGTRNAADSKFVHERTVGGEGVRLRRAPVNGDILELMYSNDVIKLCTEIVPGENNWVHVKRISTGTKGYMRYDLYDHA